MPYLQSWHFSRASTGIIPVANPDSIVNIRAGAGSEFGLFAIAQPNESVTIIAHNLSQECNSWLGVKFDSGRIGWVHERYVQRD